MAYVGGALTLVTPSIEGTFNVFAYVTQDSISTVTDPGYFADGVTRGMGVGDWVFCAAAGYPFLMYVVGEAGIACTAEVASLAMGSSATSGFIQMAQGQTYPSGRRVEIDCISDGSIILTMADGSTRTRVIYAGLSGIATTVFDYAVTSWSLPGSGAAGVAGVYNGK